MSQELITVAPSHSLATANSFNEALYTRFIEFLDVKEKTAETYTKALKRLFKYFSDNGIGEPSRADIIAFRDELKATTKASTVKTYLTATRLFFRWLDQEGMYKNIADKVKGAKVEHGHKKDALTIDQVKDVLSTFSNDEATAKRNYAIFVLMVTCGLRTIEVSRADVEDLRTVGENTVLYIQGKGREEKTEYIKISAPVEKAIRSYLKARENVEEGQPLFTSTSNNSKGKRITTRTVSGVVKTALRNAGYDSARLTAHSLRHTAITLALLAGREITEVQQFARHANLNTTMIYNHALDQAKNGCSDAISSAIF